MEVKIWLNTKGTEERVVMPKLLFEIKLTEKLLIIIANINPSSQGKIFFLYILKYLISSKYTW